VSNCRLRGLVLALAGVGLVCVSAVGGTGDSNGDGRVSFLDVRICLQCVVGDPGPNAICSECDVNGDGNVTMADVYLLALIVIGASGSPVAEISASPEFGFSPLEVQFDMSGSHDPDGAIVRYELDFGDGSAIGAGTDTASTEVHVYSGEGTHTVVLTVWDDSGLTDQASVEVRVSEPECEVVLGDGLVVGAGQSLEYSDTVLCVDDPGLQIDGTLVVTNTTLRLLQDSEQEIVNRVNGSLTLDNVDMPSDHGYYIYVWGQANISESNFPKGSRIYSGDNSGTAVTVTGSEVGGIAAQGPRSEFLATDSVVQDLVDIDALGTLNGFLLLNGVAPGYFEHWDSSTDLTSTDWRYGHLELVRTTVNSWRVRLGGAGTEVRIENSEIGSLDCHWSNLETSGPAVVASASAESLSCYNCGHVVSFEDAVVGELSVVQSDMELEGAVQFVSSDVQWQNSRLTRRYPVVVRYSDGSLASGIELELVHPSGFIEDLGVSDGSGGASFEIAFDDASWNLQWSLRAPLEGSSASVDLVETTPVVLVISP